VKGSKDEKRKINTFEVYLRYLSILLKLIEKEKGEYFWINKSDNFDGS
jgi:hypothetical protein